MNQRRVATTRAWALDGIGAFERLGGSEPGPDLWVSCFEEDADGRHMAKRAESLGIWHGVENVTKELSLVRQSMSFQDRPSG